MSDSVIREFDLYEPVRLWLDYYIRDSYKGYDVVTVDSHSQRLDRVLISHGVTCEVATGVDIKIDVLGIAQKKDKICLFFVEVKKTSLTLRDLGQLWAYCKLIDPEEAFLLTSSDFGSLNKIINTFNRDDLLDFGDSSRIKKMKLAVWDVRSGSPDQVYTIPKI